jgi:hypothetical protein
MITEFKFLSGKKELDKRKICYNLVRSQLTSDDFITTIYPKEFLEYGYKIRINFIRELIDNITGEVGYYTNVTYIPTIMGEMYFYTFSIMQHELR